uniref:Uncharacterized protein n=1 Tax=Nelumbo nucifera TaxID=4432 RepID=A0A822XZH3_NELNU|nr:TPA_asm: hypothetical protein HUJ06_027248 [Nelumbo nucifera]
MTKMTNDGACRGNTSTTELFLRGTRAVPVHCLYVKKNRPLVLVIPIERRRREEGQRRRGPSKKPLIHKMLQTYLCTRTSTRVSEKRGRGDGKKRGRGEESPRKSRLYDANPDILKALEGPTSKCQSWFPIN